MIGQNTTQIKNDQKPWRTVLRDAIVIVLACAGSKLAAKTYEYVCGHVGEVLYEIMVAWLLMFSASLGVSYVIRRRRE